MKLLYFSKVIKVAMIIGSLCIFGTNPLSLRSADAILIKITIDNHTSENKQWHLCLIDTDTICSLSRERYISRW